MISSALVVLLAAALSVQATPVPQGVTAIIAPSAPVPTQCKITYDGLFAIAAVKAEGVPIPTTLSNKRRQAKQQSDGQVTASSASSLVSQISDAQPQAPKTTASVISQISDAQPQAPASTSTMMHVALSQIGDGQVQAYYSTVPVVSQISDAQPQAPTATVISQISDAQPQAPKTTASAVSQISDAQPQVSTLKTSTLAPTGTGSGAAPSVSMVACKTNSTLEIDLKNGQLKDGKGRFGYIASNFQFQFDAGVPQAGALYTAGFSVCENGTLALGGSAIFWQCLSGTFYNLYDRHWAPQCSPVFLEVVGLKDC